MVLPQNKSTSNQGVLSQEVLHTAIQVSNVLLKSNEDPQYLTVLSSLSSTLRERWGRQALVPSSLPSNKVSESPGGTLLLLFEWQSVQVVAAIPTPLPPILCRDWVTLVCTRNIGSTAQPSLGVPRTGGVMEKSSSWTDHLIGLNHPPKLHGHLKWVKPGGWGHGIPSCNLWSLADWVTLGYARGRRHFPAT